MKKPTRLLIGTALTVLAAAAVLALLLIARQDFTAFPKGTKDALAAVSDLLALLAVSFIFLDIVTGSFRPMLRNVFNPDRLRTAHIVFGVTGLLISPGALVPALALHKLSLLRGKPRTLLFRAACLVAATAHYRHSALQEATLRDLAPCPFSELPRLCLRGRPRARSGTGPHGRRDEGGLLHFRSGGDGRARLPSGFHGLEVQDISGKCRRRALTDIFPMCPPI